MSSLPEYSQNRIGQIWGEDDHLFLVLHLRKIDEVIQAIHKLLDKPVARETKAA